MREDCRGRVGGDSITGQAVLRTVSFPVRAFSAHGGFCRKTLSPGRGTGSMVLCLWFFPAVTIFRAALAHLHVSLDSKFPVPPSPCFSLFPTQRWFSLLPGPQFIAAGCCSVFHRMLLPHILGRPQLPAPATVPPRMSWPSSTHVAEVDFS